MNAATKQNGNTRKGGTVAAYVLGMNATDKQKSYINGYGETVVIRLEGTIEVFDWLGEKLITYPADHIMAEIAQEELLEVLDMY